MNINAFVLGIAQGGMNYYYLTYRYPAKEEANIFARHLQLWYKHNSPNRSPKFIKSYHSVEAEADFLALLFFLLIV
jgi:hypothetical protein